MNRDTRRTRLVLTLLVLISITLLAIDYRDGRGGFLGRARSVASDVFGPVERAFSDVADPVGHFFSSVIHLDSYKGEASRLARANRTLAAELNQARLSRPEERQLRALIGLSGVGQDKVVPAEVIAMGGALGFDDVATIDAGRSAGVRLDDTVVNGQGLVGVVSSVGDYSSVVTLAIDPGEVIGARLQRNLQLGTVHGAGLQSSMTFEAFSPREHPRPGDLLVTVGRVDGSMYVAGIPIGTVISAAEGAQGTANATVRPAVAFDSLDIVGVVVSAPRSTPHGPVIGPLPTVTVTRTVTARPHPGVSRSPGSSAGGSSTGPSPPG